MFDSIEKTGVPFWLWLRKSATIAYIPVFAIEILGGVLDSAYWHAGVVAQQVILPLAIGGLSFGAAVYLCRQRPALQQRAKLAWLLPAALLVTMMILQASSTGWQFQLVVSDFVWDTASRGEGGPSFFIDMFTYPVLSAVAFCFGAAVAGRRRTAGEATAAEAGNRD